MEFVKRTLMQAHASIILAIIFRREDGWAVNHFLSSTLKFLFAYKNDGVIGREPFKKSKKGYT